MQKSFIITFCLLLTALTAGQAFALQCKSLFQIVEYTSYADHVISEAKKIDGHLRLSLGGIGEVPNAVNINLLIDPRHANMNIPRLIRSDMRDMPFVKNSTVDEMYCFACPGSHDFFDQVATEAHRVLKVGGKIQITTNSFASPWVAALEKLGFAIERSGDRVVYARKVSEQKP